MAKKPAYGELEQRVHELEKKASRPKHTGDEIKREQDIFLGGPVVIFNWLAIENWPAGYVSPNVTQFGYQADDLTTGRIHYVDIIHPEDLERVLSEVGEYIKSGVAFYEQQYRIIQANGEVKWVYDFTIVRRNNQSEITHYDGYILDITKRRKAERALRESEERFRSLFNTMAEAVVLIDPDGQIVQANPAAERILGLRRSEIEGRNYVAPEWEIIRHDRTPMSSEEMAGPRAMKEKRLVKDVVMGSKRPDGSISWINVSASPLINQAGQVEGIVGTFADITHKKEAEDALRKREAELEVQSRHLKEVNNALKVLLKQREEDKKELEENVLSNVKQLVSSHLVRLKESRLDADQTILVSILESNLSNIVSPLISRLSSKFLHLTPMEIRVADLIKEGKTNKEIGALLSLSPNTVKFHRYNLRSKLGLKNKKMNLRTHLLSLAK